MSGGMCPSPLKLICSLHRAFHVLFHNITFMPIGIVVVIIVSVFI